MQARPISVVEFEYAGCALTFGSPACGAVLSADVPCKCFGTMATCARPDAFFPVAKVLRFCDPRPDFKPADLHFPALVSVSSISATANIAGADESMGALGRRATVSIELQDFPYHDRATDPYQSERISGSAQFDGVGYDPAARGTFFGRLKARWPYYPGKPLRLTQGFIGAAGDLIDAQTRHYVIDDISPPDASGRVKIEAKDILSLADNDKALAPAPSKGVLVAAISDTDTALTLGAAGAGDAYPAAGRAVIGSELVEYTRAGDLVTLTARGLSNTKAASHAAGDTFQEVLRFQDARIDTVISALLLTYAKVPASYIDAAAWNEEARRWLSQYRLTRDICTPTGVAKLAAELAQFGVSIFPTAAGNKIGLKANRPPDGDTVYNLAEVSDLIKISPEERPKDRITEVFFYTVQIDPTKSVTDTANFARMLPRFDADAKSANRYGDTKIKRVLCPWLNDGRDGVASAVSLRLLRRFRETPLRVKIRLAWKDAGIEIADVVNISARMLQDGTGAARVVPMQVIGRSDPKPGHEIELTLQSYAFAGRYGYSTENTRPSYAASSSAQRERGMYACDPVTLKQSNGDEPYRAI